MGLLNPTFLTTSVIAVILFIVLIVRFRSDVAAIHTARLRKRKLILIASKRVQKPITVIVTLTRRASSLFPLLDSLRHNSGKIEVIVVVKQTAGKNVRKDLTNYKKKYGLNIRCLRYKASDTLLSTTRLHAKGGYVVNLGPDARVIAHTFTRLCIDFAIHPHVDAIRMRQFIQPGKSILSGLAALAALTTQPPSSMQANTLVTELLPYVAYRRSSLKKPKKLIQTLSDRPVGVLLALTNSPSSYVSSIHFFAQRLGILTAIFYLLAGLCVVIIFMVINPSQYSLMAAVIIVSYTLTLSLHVLEHRAFRYTDVVSLVLLAPLHALFMMSSSFAKIITRRRR